MRKLAVVLVAALAVVKADAAAPLPIFDAHVHYSHDAWEMVPPKEAIAVSYTHLTLPTIYSV